MLLLKYIKAEEKCISFIASLDWLISLLSLYDQIGVGLGVNEVKWSGTAKLIIVESGVGK